MKLSMKSKMVKVVAGTMLAALVFTGCASSSDPKASTASTAGASESGGGGTVKVGFMSDQSGENAQSATSRGFQLAVDEINAAGGVLGKQIEPIIADGQSNTQRYQEMAKQFVLQDKVAVAFSSGTSASREAIRPVFEENKLLYIYPTFYEGGVASKYNLCTGSTPEQAIKPLIEYVVDNNLGKKVYIIAADYNYGHISTQWVEKYCEELGLETVGTEFVPLGVSQFSTSISKIQQSGADIVYTLLVGSAQFSFFEQWGTSGLSDVNLISTCNIAYSYDHKRVAAPILEGMVASGTFFEEMDTAPAKKFVEAFRAKYPDEAYIYNEPEGIYAAVYLWKNACEKAGSFDTEAVISAFQTGEISFDAPSGKISVDGATNHASLTVSIAQIQADHTLKIVETKADMEPTYLKELGIDLRVEDPHKQFTPLD